MIRTPADRFAERLAAHDRPALTRRAPTTLQVNLGKLCNQACRHCHVDAGPSRTELMGETTMQRVLSVLRGSPGITAVDVTGGAPELNPLFRRFVEGVRAAERDVRVRCNLTVLFEPGQDDLPEFYARHHVTIIASLPCYTAENTDAQRGGGVFEKSVAALAALNAVGFGASEGEERLPDGGDPTAPRPLRLHLVYNPLGPSLPPTQHALEADYRERLMQDHGLRFDRLFALANMPIHRFAEDLERQGALQSYTDLLASAFNADAVDDVMCRDLVSIDWDGRLSDCDFNQMLRLPLGTAVDAPATIFDLDDLGRLAGDRVHTATHCLGCTAGQGSSCGGALSASAH